jgi:predicted RNA methylase
VAVLFEPERSPDRPHDQIAFTRMGLKMKSYKRVIGIDICTERLDIADSNSKIAKAIEYSVDTIKTKIIKLVK